MFQISIFSITNSLSFQLGQVMSDKRMTHRKLEKHSSSKSDGTLNLDNYFSVSLIHRFNLLYF
jgi:hypothetical protein